MYTRVYYIVSCSDIVADVVVAISAALANAVALSLSIKSTKKILSLSGCM